MPEQKFWRNFNKLMDQYIRYNGRWHNADCDFIYHDQGVCNCQIRKNSFIVKQKLLSMFKHAESKDKKPTVSGRATAMGAVVYDKNGKSYILTTI